MISLVALMAASTCFADETHMHEGARAANHGPIIRVTNRVVDLGDIRQNERISGSFFIENHGNEDLIIDQVFSHCGCTVVALSDEEKIIPPESRQKVTAFFSSEDRQGRQRKAVTITSNDPEVPTVVVTVKSNVLASFRVEPSQFVALNAVHRGDRLAPLEIFATDEGTTLENLEVEIQGGLLDYALESMLNDAGVAGVRLTMQVAQEIELGEIDTQMLLRGTVDGKEQIVVVRVKGKVVGPIEVRPPRIESTQPTPRGRTFGPITLRPTDGRTFAVTDIEGTNLEGTHRPGKKPGDVEIVLKLDENVPDGPFGEIVRIATDHPNAPFVEIPVFVNVRPRCEVEPSRVYFKRDTPSIVHRVRFQSYLVSALEIRNASCDNPSFTIEIVEPENGSSKVRFVDVRWVGEEKATDSPKVSATLTVRTNVPGAETVEVPVVY
ncbi:MAG: DUF1573 domain-containing protein [Planctomycetes bacterium]|nr:DUF1573 domain-containing protein [Planctomycetota bacterium]